MATQGPTLVRTVNSWGGVGGLGMRTELGCGGRSGVLRGAGVYGGGARTHSGSTGHMGAEACGEASLVLWNLRWPGVGIEAEEAGLAWGVLHGRLRWDFTVQSPGR